VKNFTLLNILFTLTILTTTCFGQKTIVKGTIINKISKDSIPFVSVIFKNTTIGTVSNEFGRYDIETSKKVDSIIVSYIGYKRQTIAIQRNKNQLIDIALEPDNYNLDEVTIKPKRNPAFRILDNVVSHKDQNKSSSVNISQCEEYEKFQIYYGNYSEKLTKRKQFKNFEFMFQNADSTADGKPLLPIYMSETIRQNFNCDNPNIHDAILIAEKTTGESYEQLTAITNKMVENTAIYDNFFLILDKSFISPITDNYQLYYKYYLEDSVMIDNNRCYQIRFVPKWKEDLAFSGTMYIHDTTWAVKKINYSINNEINLNYVKDFSVSQEFTRIQNTWLQKKMETTATISPLKRKKSQEFMIHRVTSYKDFTINNSEEIKKNYDALKTTKTINVQKDNAYWQTARHDSLTKKEKNNYMIADTLNYVPVIKKIKKVAIAFASGYLELGKISIGQIHTFYSFNPIEQDRYKFGLKTNKYFSKKFQAEGYVAYGSKDKNFQYKVSALYVLNKDRNRTTLGASYLYDLAQLGVSSNLIQFDNILTTLTRTNPFSKLTLNKEVKVYVEKYWSKNISNKLTLSTTEINALGELQFHKKLNETDTTYRNLTNITTSEVALNTRISFKEDVFNSEFKRVFLGSKYPIINLNVIFGLKDVFHSNYDYQKVKLNIKGTLRLNPIGHTQYTLEGGKIFGIVPYPLLELHPGNQTLIYDPESFNLMTYFEFGSNQYVSLFLDHHFDGFILNKIPLIKKAKLREVFSMHSVIGNLQDNYKKEMILPKGLTDVTTPYVELSAGLENIFKVIRIDYIWRVTHFAENPINNWSIKAKLYFSF
jgi:hypothetical protein